MAMSDLTRTRLMALIGAHEDTRYEAGPGADRLAPAKMLPVADVLLLVASDDPDAMLFRYTAYGEMGGDSWHATVAEAKEQALEEYGDALLPWEAVPDEVADAHGYAIQYASERLNSRGNW
jgi:hypothetical protein